MGERNDGGVGGKDVGGLRVQKDEVGCGEKGRFKKPGESNWILLSMKDSVIFSDHSLSSTPSSEKKTKNDSK